MFKMLMYIGERSMYGRKLVNICHGSRASKLLNAYTGTASGQPNTIHTTEKSTAYIHT